MGSHMPSSKDFFSFISGGWTLLCKECIMAEDSPHNYNHAAHNVLILVFLLVSVRCDKSPAKANY